jgi:hypothetical protein
MSVFDPKQDGAVVAGLMDDHLKPIVDAAIANLIAGAAGQVVPALQAALQNALDGLTITVTVSKKP